MLLNFHVCNCLSLYNRNTWYRFNLLQKSASGAKPFSSHGPKSARGTVVMSLKSRHPPQTRRFTFASALAFLISGNRSSTTFAIASREAESLLFPSYLQRHSRHTRLKDIEPLARGTSAMAVECWRPTKAGGANADAEARSTVRTAVFMLS